MSSFWTRSRPPANQYVLIKPFLKHEKSTGIGTVGIEVSEVVMVDEVVMVVVGEVVVMVG